MGQRNRQRDAFWAHARNVCGLNDRQVEMARKLGMNPKKLPRLKPAPSEPWKLPVGAFIEQCYAKRFKPDLGKVGGRAPKANAPVGHRLDASADRGMDLAANLACHLANLQLDLDEALAAGRVQQELLNRIARDLRQTAHEIETGEVVSQMPYTDLEFGGDPAELGE